jgi:chromosome segregation ATPase
MPRDAELDRLWSTLRAFREDSRTFKTEMDNTFDEIRAIRDELNNLYESKRISWQNIKYHRKEFDHARSVRDPADASDFGRTLDRDYQEMEQLDREISRLKDRTSLLWDQHNAAKERRRAAIDSCREIEVEIQGRKEWIANNRGRATRERGKT